MLVVIHILSYTPTNLINPADNIVLTPADIELRQYGSKLVLVVEETQMFTVWAIKGCFLLMYSRLTYVTPSFNTGWPPIASLSNSSSSATLLANTISTSAPTVSA